VAGGVIGAAVIEHPELLHNPWLLGSAAVGYPAAKVLYSKRGQRLATGLLGAVGQVPPAVAPYGPAAGQVAPGLLTGLPNRQTQP
jgi:hypothetical protein